MHEQRALCWQTIAKPRRWHFRMETAHSHSAQLTQKEEKNRKKGLDRLWIVPRHSLAISPAVHAHWAADGQRCCARRQAQRAPSAFAFIIAKSKSHIYIYIFFKYPRGSGFTIARLQSHPLPKTNELAWVWLTSLHHLQVSPLLSRCFGSVRRLRTELSGHDAETLWCEPEQVQSL